MLQISNMQQHFYLRPINFYAPQLSEKTSKNTMFFFFCLPLMYSRVHISSDTASLKILKKPSIVQE